VVVFGSHVALQSHEQVQYLLFVLVFTPSNITGNVALHEGSISGFVHWHPQTQFLSDAAVLGRIIRFIAFAWSTRKQSATMEHAKSRLKYFFKFSYMNKKIYKSAFLFVRVT
jgi:hypothetical protein